MRTQPPTSGNVTANPQSSDPTYLDPDQDEIPTGKRFGIAPPDTYIPSAVGNMSVNGGTYQTIPINPYVLAPILYRQAPISAYYYRDPRGIYFGYGPSKWLRKHGYYDNYP